MGAEFHQVLATLVSESKGLFDMVREAMVALATAADPEEIRRLNAKVETCKRRMATVDEECRCWLQVRMMPWWTTMVHPTPGGAG